jgi:dienelactone hydrolase
MTGDVVANLLDNFARFQFPDSGRLEAGTVAHDVYRTGTGPPVLIMHELPGFTLPLVKFALRLAEERFTIYLPHLFGSFMKPCSLGNFRALCVSREFANLQAGVTAPIASWLRDLAREISTRHGNRRVGAIGMCLTGAFVIPLVLDPVVSAAVAAQPAIPFSILHAVTGLGHGHWMKELNVSNKDVAAARQALYERNQTILALRFAEDRICPREKLTRLREEFEDRLEAEEYDGASVWQRWFWPRHSTLTGEYDKASRGSPGHPTRKAFARVSSFLRQHLESD